MIVQTASEGKPHLVILQTDHAETCGQIAKAFGNSEFAAPEPFAAMMYVAEHHDDGWLTVDPQIGVNPETHFPYSLTETPLPFLLKTSAGSPAINEQFHPYSGMMSSMHTVGLFHGRYTVSEKIFIDTVPMAQRTAVAAMLAAELDRQDKLKEMIEANQETAVYMQDAYLFHNYKLLQFFDTLALYFQMTHEVHRNNSFFENVPQSVGNDVTMTIKSVGVGVYALSPYPFREDSLTISFKGRPMMPQPIGANVKVLMDTIEPITETVTLTALA